MERAVSRLLLRPIVRLGATGGFVAFVCLALVGGAVAGDRTRTVSPLNGLPLPDNAADGSCSFLAIGHAYGSGSNLTSVYPAATFLANISRINESGADFLVLLGDNFRRPTTVQIDNFERVMKAVHIPVFNAAGNHDLKNRTVYEERFGPTYYDFVRGPNMFLVLDSELNRPIEITGQQFDFFREQMGRALDDPAIKNVFVFSHKLLWSRDDPRLNIVLDHSHARTAEFPEGSYTNTIEPVIHRVAERKNVYWISGDIGTGHGVFPQLSLFYWKDPERNAWFIATGLGDQEGDAMVRVDIDGQGSVAFTGVSLGGKELGDIKQYGPSFWERHYAPADAPSPVSKRIRTAFRNRLFWTGAAFSGVLLIVLLVVISSIKRVS